MVTHDAVAASYADRTVFLADGRLAGRLDRASVTEINEHMTSLAAR